VNDTSIDQRLLKLEIIVQGHAEDLKELSNTSKMLKDSLNAIEKTLQQIKWLAIGGALTFISNEIGIIKVLKTLML
jgi:hypothetical protein